MTPIVSATLLRTQTDARLALLAGQGYERAFEAIVERYRKPLHRYVRRVLPESRAEDAVQQTFLKAWSALGGRTQVSDLRPWLYRIAHNTALDAVKRSGYDYEELNESLRAPDAPEADHERRAVMRETLAGVAALPERQREALLRTAVAGQSRAEVASALELTDGAVRQLVHRARMTLRAAATAVTPLPLAATAAGSGRGAGTPTAARLAELVAGGGAAGGASVLIKGGAVLVAAGALATGPAVLYSGPHHGRGEADAADAATGPQEREHTAGARLRAAGAELERDASGRRAAAAGPGDFGPRAGGALSPRQSVASAGERSGPDSSRSGSGDRSGSSGSGDGSGSSGPDPSGDGSGSSGSGSGSGDSASSGPGSGDSSSGTSGAGTSGSGDSGSSGPGDSGSGAFGAGTSGSGDGLPGS